MPDRVLPLVVTDDSRAQNMNMGIGNVNLSPLGSFLEGFEKSSALWTDIEAKRLETKRLNDPARLAAEQLKRELENKVLQEAIQKATIQNEYLKEQIELGIDLDKENLATKKRANILGSKYDEQIIQGNIASQKVATESAAFELGQDKKYSDEERQLKLQRERLQGTLDEKYLERERESQAREREILNKQREVNTRAVEESLEIDKDILQETLRQKEIANDQAQFNLETGAGTTDAQYKARQAAREDARLRVSIAQKSIDALEKRKQEKLDAYKAAEAARKTDATLYRTEYGPNSTIAKSLEQVNTALSDARSKLANARNDKERIAASSEIAPLEAEKANLEQKIAAARSSLEPIPLPDTSAIDKEIAEHRKRLEDTFANYNINKDTESTEYDRKTLIEAIQAERENSRARTSKARVGLVAEYAAQAQQAYESSTVENPNIVPMMKPLMIMAEAAKEEKDPEAKALIQQELATVVENGGGIDAFEEAIKGLPEGERRDNLKKAIFAAAIETDNPNILNDEQRVMMNAGLTPGHLADPEGTKAKITQILSGQGAQVKDPSLIPLRTHPYFSAAQRASKNATQGYTISSREEAPNMTSAETGQPSGGQIFTVFTGADGQEIVAAAPKTVQDQAVWALLEDVSTGIGGTVSQKAFNDRAISGVQKTQAQVVDSVKDKSSPQQAQQQQQQAPLQNGQPTNLLESLMQEEVKKFFNKGIARGMDRKRLEEMLPQYLPSMRQSVIAKNPDAENLPPRTSAPAQAPAQTPAQTPAQAPAQTPAQTPAQAPTASEQPRTSISQRVKNIFSDLDKKVPTLLKKAVEAPDKFKESYLDTADKTLEDFKKGYEVLVARYPQELNQKLQSDPAFRFLVDLLTGPKGSAVDTSRMTSSQGASASRDVY